MFDEVFKRRGTGRTQVSDEPGEFEREIDNPRSHIGYWCTCSIERPSV